MKKLLWIISLLIYSCSPEDLFIEVEPAEDKMAISSYFIPDSLLVVTVSESFSALLTDNADSLSTEDVSSFLVENARVEVRNNGEAKILDQLGDSTGIYFGIIGTVQAGDFIELTVYDSASGKSIKAVTEAMPQIQLSDTQLIKEITDDDTTSIFKFNFTDPPETSNWYVLHIYGINDVSEDLNDSLLFNLAGNNDLLIHSELIADVEYDQSQIERTVEIPFYNSPDTVAYMFTNITEGYYRFLDARQRTGGLIASATNEPINHPTNVTNGYGYFNIHVPYFTTSVSEK